jgi:hypothetical protein
MQMAYELTQDALNKALVLTLTGDYLVEEAKEANQRIVNELTQSHTQLSLLINAMDMNRPYNFSDIRTIHTFMDHLKLKSIYVATGDRLVKLSMMIIFNLSRASLHICEDMEKATSMLQKHQASPQ